MRIEKLVMMANQIAAFFSAQGEERAIPQIAGLIRAHTKLTSSQKAIAAYRKQ